MKKYSVLILFLLSCSTGQFEELDVDQLPQDWGKAKRAWIPVVKVQPYYPDFWVVRKVEGCTRVEFVVNSHGTTQQARVVKSIPEGAFDEVSLAALKRFLYNPSDHNAMREPVRKWEVFFFVLPGDNVERRREHWAAQCR